MRDGFSRHKCNKPFIVVEGADLATEVLQQQSKKQTHSALLSIHPATYLLSRKWAEFEMTTQHNQPLRRSYGAFQIPSVVLAIDNTDLGQSTTHCCSRSDKLVLVGGCDVS